MCRINVNEPVQQTLNWLHEVLCAVASLVMSQIFNINHCKHRWYNDPYLCTWQLFLYIYIVTSIQTAIDVAPCEWSSQASNKYPSHTIALQIMCIRTSGFSWSVNGSNSMSCFGCRFSQHLKIFKMWGKCYFSLWTEKGLKMWFYVFRFQCFYFGLKWWT